MNTNIYIKGIEGITEENICFIAKARNREKSEKVKKTKDGLFINKQLVITGANATGKTSTLKAIKSVRNFVSFANTLNRFLNSRKFKDNELERIEDVLKDRYEINQNVNFQNNKSIFKDEIYIETVDEKTTGYYEYELVFSGNIVNDGVDSEKLTFRKKYNLKNRDIISYKTNIMNSQVGYMYTFLNNFNELNEEESIKLKRIKEFYNSFVYGNLFYEFKEDDISAIKWIENDKEKALEILNLVDNQFIDIYVREQKGIYSNDRYEFITKNLKILKFKQLSKGTQKILGLLNEILSAARDGCTIFIDEIESNINKSFINFILKLFYNYNNFSQIIFTTNYPDIITDDFTYDQIYLIHKEGDETIGERLIDFRDENGKKIRQDISFAKAYFNGRFINSKERESSEEAMNAFFEKYSLK